MGAGQHRRRQPGNPRLRHRQGSDCWATRTLSSSSPPRRPATSTSSSTGAAAPSRVTKTASSHSGRSGPRLAAHRLRGRHHRPRPHPGALRAGDEARHPRLPGSTSRGGSWRARACVGVVCWDLPNGGLKLLSGKSTVLATGGLGQIFRVTTNAYACTGDGAAMALRVGVPLKDMEFMQYHPTTLYPSGILLTEGCRGEGAYLISSGRRTSWPKYAPNAMELASRDVVSRSGWSRDRRGSRRATRCCSTCAISAPRRSSPGCRARASCRWRYAGVDPIYDPVSRHQRPLPHGRRGDRQRRRDRAGGLYAAGEVACVSVHGSSRLELETRS